MRRPCPGKGCGQGLREPGLLEVLSEPACRGDDRSTFPLDARYGGFRDADTAQQLAQPVPGTVLPFAFDPQLELMADPDVAAQPQLYFNAARLDQSLVTSGADYVALVRPPLDHSRAEPV